MLNSQLVKETLTVLHKTILSGVVLHSAQHYSTTLKDSTIHCLVLAYGNTHWLYKEREASGRHLTVKSDLFISTYQQKSKSETLQLSL